MIDGWSLVVSHWWLVIWGVAGADFELEELYFALALG